MFYRAPLVFLISLISLVATHQIAAHGPSIPLYFEKNSGQIGPAVRYLAREPGVVRLFEPHEVRWQFANSPEGLRMVFENPDRASAIEGRDALTGKVNYITGDDSRTWIRNVECYSQIRYRNIFPGVNVDFRNSSGSLEYDVIVNPGADLARVRLVFSGARSSRLTESGDLVFETAAGPMRHHAPIAWQVIHGERRSVTARFAVYRHGPDTEVGFSIKSWDRTVPLTIDPVVTYDQNIGVSGISNAIQRIAVDGEGNVYVAALQYAFYDPPAGPKPPPSLPFLQMCAAKLKADGSGFVYNTCFTPEIISGVGALAIDSSGNAWIAGYTSSPNFRVTANAFQKVFPACTSAIGSCTHGFVLGINPSGENYFYGTLLGGSGTDLISGMAIAADGTIWTSGSTSSSDFPVTSSAFQAKLNGPQDAFLTHLNWKTATLQYSTYFGGSGYETSAGIAMDAQGGIYIGGATNSSDLPVSMSALQSTYGGGTDAFFAKFSGDNPKLLFATYWGGSNGEIPRALAADFAGNLYAGVSTPYFPVPLGTPIAGSFIVRASLMKIDPTGSKVVWTNQFLGEVQEIAVDAAGRLTAVGNASAPALTPNALYTCQQPEGSFLLQLEADGKTVRYGSFVPASHVALDSGGSVYLAGGTMIEKQDFSKETPMAATCILGATQFFGDAVAPGEIISIYGRNIGPAQGVTGTLDSFGRLPFTLGGVSVTFDGAPAPLLYAQAGQINAIVPMTVVGKRSASVQVTWNGSAAPPVPAALRDASNILAASNGRVAAINEDGTVNSNDHPAKPGSIVSIFSSGGGQTNPRSTDGQIANAAWPLVLPVKVVLNGSTPVSAEVLYAGSAPGQVAGTVQINFRVPIDPPLSNIGAGRPNLEVAIVIGGDQEIHSSNGAIFVG